MRAYLPDYQCSSAKSLSEALRLLENGARPIAGGTDIMVLFDAGLLAPGDYVDILGLSELKGITQKKNTLTLGALTTYSEVRQHRFLQTNFPILCDGAKEVGAVAIQNRGTLGGNIANASPAADFPPALLVYEAKIHLVSSRGMRTIDYTKFHHGYKESELKKDELIHSVSLENQLSKHHHFWRKIGSRKAQAISKTMMAGVLKLNKNVIEEVRISFGSVAPTAVRCTEVEKFLTGCALNKNTIREAKQILLKDIHPIDDIRSTGKYRLAVSQNVLEEFLCGIG